MKKILFYQKPYITGKLYLSTYQIWKKYCGTYQISLKNNIKILYYFVQKLHNFWSTCHSNHNSNLVNSILICYNMILIILHLYYIYLIHTGGKRICLTINSWFKFYIWLIVIIMNNLFFCTEKFYHYRINHSWAIMICLV